jgi:hypothetical protein
MTVLLITLLGFFLIPVVSTLAVSQIPVWKGVISCFATVNLVILFPIGVVVVRHFLNPPAPGPRCGTPEGAFYHLYLDSRSSNTFIPSIDDQL